METQNKKTARLAGLWWLLFCLITPISYLVVDGKLLIDGNETETIANISSNILLFWLGVIAFIAGYLCFILLANSLRKLFTPVDTRLAKLMVVIVRIGTILVIIGKLAEIIAVNIHDISATICLLNLRKNIEMVGELFWGVWLIPLVLLIFKSDFIPKVVGGALSLAALYHLIAFATFFITGTDVSTNIYLITLGLGEFIMVFWLLIKGIKQEKSRR